MKLIKKLISLLTILALCLSFTGIVPTATAADYYISGSYINPLYENIGDALPVIMPGPAPLLAREGVEYLTSTEDVAEELREGMKARAEEIVIHFQSEKLINTKELLKEYVQSLLPIAQAHTGVPTEGDFLRWQYGSVGFGLTAQSSNGIYYYTLTLTFSFYTTAAQEKALTQRIDTLLADLDLADSNDYEKIRAIYDYICANVTYDNENLNNSNHVLKYTAYAALMDGTAVCQGYALLFYRLALELGVDARLIAGDGGGPHGWNIAKLNNLYYNLDSTWDAGSTEYKYFLVCPDNFRDHQRYDEYNSTAFHQDYPMDEQDFDPSTVLCTHKYSATATQEVTCITPGVTTYTCSKCGNSYSKESPALGHSATIDPAVDATCTTPGKTEGSHCSRCTEILTVQEDIPALGHIQCINPAISPTCTTPGKTEGSHCSRCGIVFIAQETIAPTGHSWSDATCTAAKTCLVCNATEGSALGHDWDEGTVTKTPTETETGILTYICSRCPETMEEIIPVLAHTHTYTTKVTDPTCTDKGYTTYICECGDSFTGKETAALGHDWDEGTVTKEPTETETGTLTYTCSRCPEIKTEAIPCIAPEAQIVRLAGAGRSETAIEVAEALREKLGLVRFDSVIIANGDNFADALTGSYLAAVKNAPILLRRASGAGDAENTDYILEHLNPDGIVYILGGTSSIPEFVETDIEKLGLTVKRLSGDTRFDTNLIILEEAGVTNQEILICTGWEYADSLSASATGLPILMVNTITEELTENQITFLQKYKDNTFTIIGGPAAVSEEMKADISSLVGNIRRISGASRESTSVEVASHYCKSPDIVLLAYSRNFPDGLCGGPLAYAYGAPLLLVNASQESHAASYVQQNTISKCITLGGTSAVSDESIQIIFS